MMKGFGATTAEHNLPIDVLRMIAGVEPLGAVEPEEENEFILEGLEDIANPQGGPHEEVPRRGDVNPEELELENPEQEQRRDVIEEEVIELNEIPILPQNNEIENNEIVDNKNQNNEIQINEPPKAKNPQLLEIFNQLDKLDRDIVEEAKKKTGIRNDRRH